VLWLEEEFGWNRWEAYSFLTQVGSISTGHFRLGVVAAKIDLAYIEAHLTAGSDTWVFPIPEAPCSRPSSRPSRASASLVRSTCRLLTRDEGMASSVPVPLELDLPSGASYPRPGLSRPVFRRAFLSVRSC
jgi:hypothetical protein